MIRTILFDMDGVLIDSEPVHYELWKEVMHRHGLEIDFPHYQTCVGSDLYSLFRMAKRDYGVVFADQEAMAAEFFALREPWLREHGVPAVPDAREAVRALQRKGYCLAVASSSPQAYIEFITESLGIRDCFTALCSAQSVSHPKPAPDTFLFAAQTLGAPADECLVIEDSHNGALAAHRADMECWGFRNPNSGQQDLTTASWIFDDFSAMAERLPSLI